MNDDLTGLVYPMLTSTLRRMLSEQDPRFGKSRLDVLGPWFIDAHCLVMTAGVSRAADWLRCDVILSQGTNIPLRVFSPTMSL